MNPTLLLCTLDFAKLMSKFRTNVHDSDQLDQIFIIAFREMFSERKHLYWPTHFFILFFNIIQAFK